MESTISPSTALKSGFGNFVSGVRVIPSGLRKEVRSEGLAETFEEKRALFIALNSYRDAKTVEDRLMAIKVAIPLLTRLQKRQMGDKDTIADELHNTQKLLGQLRRDIFTACNHADPATRWLALDAVKSINSLDIIIKLVETGAYEDVRRSSLNLLFDRRSVLVSQSAKLPLPSGTLVDARVYFDSLFLNLGGKATFVDVREGAMTRLAKMGRKDLLDQIRDTSTLPHVREFIKGLYGSAVLGRVETRTAIDTFLADQFPNGMPNAKVVDLTAYREAHAGGKNLPPAGAVALSIDVDMDVPNDAVNTESTERPIRKAANE